MNSKFFSIIFVMVAVAVFLVFRATQQGTSEVLTASELGARDPNTPLHRIRVAGKVAPVEIDYKVEPKIELKFSITDPSRNPHQDKALSSNSQPSIIPVVYAGIKPDMFEAGRDVIIDGEYSQGVLTASKLLTQCPSKYEAPSPTTKYPVQKQ